MKLNDNFIGVIEKNKGIIYKVANAYCKNDEDRKDLVQEIIIKLWQSFENYNPQYSLSTWMYRISLNTAISFYRKDSRRKDISLPVSEDMMLFIKETESDETEQKI